MDEVSLERWERLHGVGMARAILRDAFSLELLLIGPQGPLAHVRGGVLASSSEVCRVSLFSREGFARCDAFYRQVGASREAVALPCHLGLATVSVPAEIDGAVLVHVVASGFVATHLPGVPPVNPEALTSALHEIDPSLADPAAPVRALPVVTGRDRIRIVRSILAAAAREIVALEADRRRRAAGAEDGSIPSFWGLVGDSPRMREVFDLVPRLAMSDATVVILGESGTGKELVARALHEHGPRAGRAFVAQNCGALPDDLLESTLFGHVRGAFSGAIRTTTGLFGAAEGGTLFLDEVGEMSPAMQVKLLRVLSDGSYLPVGSTQPGTANVRVITASHRDLGEMVARGEFRQDLFYRLHVLPVHLPPLRDRPGDLRHLVRYFLDRTPDAPAQVAEAAWRCLERYRFPGNVRELGGEVARWSFSAADARVVGPEHLSAPIREAGGYVGDEGGGAAAAAAAGAGTLAAAVEALERAIIRRGLERTAGNRTQLARELGVSRTTLNDRLKRYGMG